MFTLLGRDPNAPKAVREWAKARAKLVQNGEKPYTDMAKVRDAMEVAADMVNYRKKRQKVLRSQSVIPHYSSLKQD